MALSGNLRDFSLPDVFQLVSFSRKTGTLAIDRSDAKGFVYFREGEVFFAISNWNREPMGRRLVRGEKITDRQLQRALELQTQDTEHRRLGQILVDEGFLSPKVLETFVQEQIQDTIFDLFRWEDGEFDFKAGVIPTEEDIGLSVSVENIIMEGSRRLEEWDRIRKKIPSQDAVFRMATAPGEGTFEVSLKPSEWKLLCLLDGRRSVANLSELLDLSDFQVSRVLYGMFSGGLLERADGGGPEVTAEAATVATVEVAPQVTEVESEPQPEAEAGLEDVQELQESAEPPTVAEVVKAAEEEAGETEAVAEATVEPAANDLVEDAGVLEAGVEVDQAELDGETEAASLVEEPGAAEAASAGPTVEVPEEAAEVVEPAEEDIDIDADLSVADVLDEEEMDAGDSDLTDELAALTGTGDAKAKVGGRRTKTKAATSDVPLHVDSRVSKDLLLKIIEGIKRL